MQIKVICSTNPRKPNVVYARANDMEGNPVISATIDYVLSAAQGRGYEIINAQEVLIWLHNNVEFKIL